MDKRLNPQGLVVMTERDKGTKCLERLGLLSLSLSVFTDWLIRGIIFKHQDTSRFQMP